MDKIKNKRKCVHISLAWGAKLVFPPLHVSECLSALLRWDYVLSLFLIEAYPAVRLHGADRARKEVRQQNSILHSVNFQNKTPNVGIYSTWKSEIFMIKTHKWLRGTFRCLWNSLWIRLMIINDLEQQRHHHPLANIFTTDHTAFVQRGAKIN